MHKTPELTHPWEIFLVHHSHVDIGYTEAQPIVMRKHADYVAQALDYSTATDGLPDGERFAWTCEVSWTVRAFLERYPNRAEEFFGRVREGRIEVTGIYLNLTDLFSQELLDHALSYASDLASEHCFQLVTAMQSDVNGWAWGLPKLMVDRGIRYFDVAVNEVRALGVSPRPHPFYWASPDGARVLMWHGEHYHHGNRLRLGEDGDEERMIAYLASLEANGYPHNAVEFRISGECRDSAAPGLWICNLVRDWNTRFENPKLRLCTPRTWFEHLEKCWPEPIPELKAAWPDWWADGNGSALYEAALVRAAQADIANAEAVAGLGGESDLIGLNAAREAAMFFAEHTWGASCSTERPDSPESRGQWAIKSAFAHVAAAEAKNALHSIFSSSSDQSNGDHEVVVFNALPFRRTDLVEFMIADDRLVPDADWVKSPGERAGAPPAFHLEDIETGESIALDRRPTCADYAGMPRQIVRFVARDVPGMGKRRYRIVTGDLAATARTECRNLTLENSFFKLTVDPKTGGLASIMDVPSSRELVAVGEYALNQHIYETIASKEGRAALTDWRGLHSDTRFRRSTPTVQVLPGLPTPYGAGLVVEGGGGELPLLRTEIVLYDELPRVDLFNVVTKPHLYTPEAVYHAFPLKADSPTVYLDIPGATMRPGVDQVPGTATDWHSIQHYFAVAGSDWTTVVASPDASLVQVNGINTGLWQPELPPHNGVVMSWVMNNYWFTNFPAAQGGAIPFRYSLTGFAGPFDPEVAGRFASTIRQPLVAQVV